MNYSRFLNAVSAARKPSAIRAITALLSKMPTSTINMATGMPNTSMFPLEYLEVKLKSGDLIHINEAVLDMALQYMPTSGYPPLLSWLRDFQVGLHKPPTAKIPAKDGGLDMLVSVGTQDGICKAMEMLVGPGDFVLADSPAYPGALAILKPLGCTILPVETDGSGMKPDVMRSTLGRWTVKDKYDPASTIPRVVYTCPTGNNPSGGSLTLDRKKEIYKIAQEYDLLLLEDDPYYFLQFNGVNPSFLSLDTDGRVLRFDSFSKVVSSGIRLGFVSGPEELLSRINLHMQASVMHASSIAQVLMHELLIGWGEDGFLEHAKEVSQFYEKQKDCAMEAASKWLIGLAEWEEPVAGMFLWIKILGISDTKTLIEGKASKQNIMFVPGSYFYPDTSVPSQYIRASYSTATYEQMNTAFQKLAELIKEELDE